MTDLSTLTNLNKQPVDTPADPSLIVAVEQIKNNEMSQRIDTVLFECVGQTMNFNQLIRYIKTTDPVAYEYVIGYAQEILQPIYALS
jgi:hypothetical protein